VDRATRKSRRQLLARLLRTLREERGLLQLELAERLGEPQSYLSKLESGERRLEFVRLEEVCAALGVPPEEFLARWLAELAREEKSRPDD
jgi:transcriptional regulator with XRE-family HTH domain